MKQGTACLILLLLAGCGGALSFERDRRLYGGADYAVSRPPFGPLRLKVSADKRPIVEHGQSGYMERNYISGERFGKPTLDVLRDVILMEIERSRLFSPVSVASSGERYTLTIDVVHFYGSSDGGVGDVLVFLPAVSVDAEVQFKAVLVDDEGRRYLEKEYRRRRESTTVGFADRGSVAASLLGECLTDVCNELLRDLDSAVQSFWQSLGLPVPASGNQ
jgi:hypothetical protein